MKKTISTIWRFTRWPLLGLCTAYAALVIYRIPALTEQKHTQKVVAQIHAQKITMDDVMGKKLPPAPNSAQNDATLVGIDANKNGIRDDVELAIFKKYPDSATIRAAELQYARTEQMFLTHVTNKDTWKAVAEEDARAELCIIDSHANRKEVEDVVFNTDARVHARETAYDFTTSYGPEPGRPCDISVY